MRASLVSATSLIALLLVDEYSAHAAAVLTATQSPLYYLAGSSGTASAPESITVTGAGPVLGFDSTLSLSTPTTSGFAITPSSTTITSSAQVVTETATFAFGSLTSGAISTTITATDSYIFGVGSTSIPLTLTASGVAPVQSVAAPTAAINALVGYQGSATITVSNIGNGNLFSSSGTVANLFGTIGAASSVFTGGPKTFTLNDSNYAGTGSATTSVTQAFVYTPTVRGASSATVVTSFSNGFNATNGGGAVSKTLTINGVAPVGALSASGTNYVLVGQSGSATITATNSGDGNSSGLGTISNLRGSLSAASGGFTGAAQSISLGDTSSASYSYSFAPSARGQTASALVVATLVNGAADGTNAAFGQTLTLSGTGVAPVSSISNQTNYFLVGQTTTASLTVSNIGDGNKSGAGTISNLRGSLAAGTGGFGGTSAQAFSLTDGGSTTYNYTFAPTAKGQTAAGAVVATFSNGTGSINAGSLSTIGLTGTGVAPVLAVSSTAAANLVRVGTSATSSINVTNTGNGNLATGGASPLSNLNGSVSATTLASGMSGPTAGSAISLPDAGSTTLAYTYSPTSRSGGSVTSTVTLAFSDGNSNGSNTAQTISSVFVNQAVGPVYTSSISGSGSSAMPSAVAHGAAGPAGQTIAFGTLAYNASETIYLVLSNTSTDPGGALTNLTIERYSIAGGGSYEFHPTLASGSVISEGGQLLLPITLVSSGGGALNSTLTLFTDEGASLGGSGDTFTYALTAFAVPEPAALAVLGAGLAGLAGVRRRRRPATG